MLDNEKYERMKEIKDEIRIKYIFSFSFLFSILFCIFVFIVVGDGEEIFGKFCDKK